MTTLLLPVPASDLAAYYSLNRGQLILYARGEANKNIINIRFVQRASFGGLPRFDLVGTAGGLTNSDETRPYGINQELDFAPFKEVVIADANHPAGVPIRVHYGGLNPHLHLLNIDGAESSNQAGSPRAINEILSFTGNVFIAQRIVDGKFGPAELLIVKATANLSNLEAIFLIHNGRTAIIKSDPHSWGNWGEPVEGEPIVGARAIDLIKDVRIEPKEAIKILQEHGLPVISDRFTLSFPLTGEIGGEPFYTFSLKEGPEVQVGARTGKIHTPHPPKQTATRS